MHTALTPHDEQRLLTAVQQVSQLVDDGQQPTAALTKVAAAAQLGPGLIRTVGYAFNTGRQLAQMGQGTSLVTKFAAFPLAEPETVIAQLYPAEVKTAAQQREATAVDAAWQRPPDWVHARARAKAASAALPPSPPVPPPPPDPVHSLRRRYGNYERVKRAAETSRCAAAVRLDALHVQMAKLASYFKQFADRRLPLGHVEKAAADRYGAAATAALFQYVRQFSHCRDKAAAGPLPTGLRWDAEPLTLVANCVRLGQEVQTCREKAAADQTVLTQHREECFGPFAPARPTKEAASVVPMTVGGLMANALADMPRSRNEMVEAGTRELDDPEHLAALRRIRAQAMLAHMLTDPEDTISGHDPDEVLHAYNEIAQLGPRVAEQPAAIGPLLRRRLQGHVQPFEAKEVTDIEKGLAATKPQQGSIVNAASA